MIDRGQQGDARPGGWTPPPATAVLDGGVGAAHGKPAFAHWGRRVVASLLDGAVLGLLTWVAFPVQPVAAPAPLPLAALSSTPVGSAPDADVWTSSGLVVGAVVLGLLMQAYLGSTPGKLAAGVAVVRLHDHRPAGILRVLGREVMHVIDLILLIGYLRPLWNRRRETFADTIASTVVLQTRAPLPYVLEGPVLRRWRRPSGPDRTDDVAARAPWQLPSVPRWRVVVTGVATGACLVGVAFAVAGESGRGGTGYASCTVMEPDRRDVRLTGAEVDIRDRSETRTRLGLTRPVAPESPGVVVGWTWNGEWSSDDDLRFRVAVRDASGTERRWQYAYGGDGLVVPPGQRLVDRPDAVLLPLEALAGLDGTVVVAADAVLNGSPIRGCTVETALSIDR